MVQPPVELDVAVVGGGPGGSAAATVLADGGLRVALFEREEFPRFHVGESLMPATMRLLENLGVRQAVESAGFQVKYGAMFHDGETRRAQTFYFLRGQPWPNYAYQVSRARFDTILLDNARQHGAQVFQPATVDDAVFDDAGVTLTVGHEARAMTVRARMLVDASGRDGFLATRIGRRTRIPNLGKIALFAHFRGAERASGMDEGNIRVYVRDDGWFWWIPLADDITSVGTVVHARTARAWSGPIESLFEDMLRRSPEVTASLGSAERVTPVYRAANFAYRNSPVVGDRFICVGDAIAFVDPIFSGGVFIALRTGQLAARAILDALARGEGGARRFRAYERQFWRAARPLFRLIHHYYEPAFFDTLMNPREVFGIYPAVLMVLSGGSFFRFPWRARLSLAILFGLARVNAWAMRLAGRAVESRLEW
jgi:flavin-dependent dehydrogenase